MGKEDTKLLVENLLLIIRINNTCEKCVLSVEDPSPFLSTSHMINAPRPSSSIFDQKLGSEKTRNKAMAC